MPKPLDNVPWDLIEKFMILGGTFRDASAQWGVKEDTLRKRAGRYKWPLPAVIEKRAQSRAEARRNPKTVTGRIAKVNEAIIEAAVETWEEKGEKHREAVFKLTHESIKKMKPRAPKNFREAEAADKMARRAAGLENVETVNQTLIQLNEAINDGDVIEATLSETPQSPQLPDA